MLLGVLLAAICSAEATLFYDTYTGEQISLAEVEKRKLENTTFWCVAEIEECKPNEGSRVDGSCLNPDHPTRGASHTPFGRLLPAEYADGGDYNPRTSCSGKQLINCRKASTTALAMGTVPDQMFTLLLTYVLVFVAADGVSVQDTQDYVVERPYCCLEEGKADYMCAPNPVPWDDPVHRFSGCRCMNQTKPITYQYTGCLSNKTQPIPERISSATPLLDLSIIYGSFNSSLNEKGRLFKGGLLKYEIDKKGNMWPPQMKLNESICFLNELPYETRCHDTPEVGTNSLMGINIISVYMWRYHNYIAANLARLNPCWDDNRLFWTTRDIMTAAFMQIFYYELLPPFMGRENLIRLGVIGKDNGYRDIYNSSLLPQQFLEYSYALRWVHTLQESTVKIYTVDGCFLKTLPLVNLTLRSGCLDEYLVGLSKGSTKQGCAQRGPNGHPDIKEMALGKLQKNFDLFTADLSKGRTLGFPPYGEYKEMCMKLLSKEDYINALSPAELEIVLSLYENLEDADLMLLLWLENPMRNAYTSVTFNCIVSQQLKYNIMCNPHWYERKDRVNAFTPLQLKAIRGMTMSAIMCAVSGVTSVQPSAFLREGPGNKECSCDHIKQLDLSPWKDESCDEYGETGDGSSGTGGGNGEYCGGPTD